VHIGGASGWVEWLRVHVDAQLRLDEALGDIATYREI